MLNDLMSINAGQMSALANAIEDALTPFGVSIYEAPPLGQAGFSSSLESSRSSSYPIIRICAGVSHTP